MRLRAHKPLSPPRGVDLLAIFAFLTNNSSLLVPSPELGGQGFGPLPGME